MVVENHVQPSNFWNDVYEFGKKLLGLKDNKFNECLILST
jgi:hypothetical protein